MKAFTPLLLLPLFACSSDTTTDKADTARDDDADTTDVAEPDTNPDAQVDTDTLADTDPDGDSIPDPTAGLAATVAALCPGYADLYCGASCGCADAPGFPADCKAAFEAGCASQLEGYLSIIQSGQAVFTPEGAAACLTNFAPLAAACVSFPNDLFFFVCPVIAPPEGFPPFPGVGEDCEGSCQAGLRCGTLNKCIVPGAVDDACTDGRDCATDLVCADSICVAPRQSDTGKSCAGPADCSGDTECIASIRKVCSAPVPGGPCRFDDDCPATQWCEVDSENKGTCRPGGANGESCANGTVCLEGLACDAISGDCGPLPTTGEPCALSRIGPFVCADGLACLDGTCGSPPGNGQPCAQGTPACAAGLGCAFESEGSTCRPKAGAGAECQNDDTCQDTMFCDFGINQCTSFLVAGERCTDGNECGPGGACLPDEAFDFRCAASGEVGDECFLDDCSGDLLCKTPYTAGICAPVLCSMIRF